MSEFIGNLGIGNINSISLHNILNETVQVESRGNYSAFNPNDNSKGISFGIVQFNQQTGTLLELLERCYDSSELVFLGIFKKTPAELIKLDLSNMKEQFHEFGEFEAFKIQQDKLVIERYFIPAAQTALHLGMANEIELAVLFDISIQFGVEGMRKIAGYAGKKRQNYLDYAYLWRIANRADQLSHCNRRRVIINSKKLNMFRCFVRVMMSDFNIDIGFKGLQVLLFQNMINCVLHNKTNNPADLLLKQDGVFGMKTAQSLVMALESIGLGGSGIDCTIPLKHIGIIVDSYVEIVASEESIKNAHKNT